MMRKSQTGYLLKQNRRAAGISFHLKLHRSSPLWIPFCTVEYQFGSLKYRELELSLQSILGVKFVTWY